jgi:Zn-dependent hydrolases, including glyoxylases
MIKKLIVGNMQTNCYLVYNHEKHCLVIDPGANGKKISHYIEENELQVKAILLTHGHFDHIGAVDYLYEKFNCPIYTHKETCELLYNEKLNLSVYEKPFVLKSPIQEAQNDFYINDFHIQWLLLEGHCQGSSMIYIESENALFSGDVLFAGSIGRFDFPTSSSYQTKISLQTIKQLEFDANLFPGHGESSILSYEKQNNYYLK